MKQLRTYQKPQEIQKANSYLLVYKPVGYTPLEVLQEINTSEKLAYAGRLDPMAEGLMLVLIGEECKKRDKYQKLDKKYQFDLLPGIETDTHDILGLLTDETSKEIEIPNDYLKKYIGEIEMKYPAYSSKSVNGKKLFQWAKESRLKEIEIPSKLVTIYSLKLVGNKNIDSQRLRKYIFDRINKVKGNFRQEEILNSWSDYFTRNPDRLYKIYSLEMHCSSGTYVRSLVDMIGKDLHSGAIATNINRIAIGDYTLSS